MSCVTHWILGAGLGMTCAALLLWLDVAGLGRLLWTGDRVVWEALVLLFGGFAITFGGVVCGGAVMTVPGGHDDPDGGLGAAGGNSAPPRRPAWSVDTSQAVTRGRAAVRTVPQYNLRPCASRRMSSIDVDRPKSANPCRHAK